MSLYTRTNVTLSRKLIKHCPGAILNSTYMYELKLREGERVTRGFGHGVCSVFKNIFFSDNTRVRILIFFVALSSNFFFKNSTLAWRGTKRIYGLNIYVYSNQK
jgi:hypothetical protein